MKKKLASLMLILCLLGLVLPTVIAQAKDTAVSVETPEKPYEIKNVISGIQVYWKAVGGVTKYGVWRSETGVNGTYKWIANASAVHFTDVTVESGKTYYYKISAMDQETEKHGEKSSAIGITFVATPNIISRENTADGIKLQWDKVNGATAYQIYRKLYEESSWGTAVAEIKGNTSFEWTDTNVVNGTVYSYMVRAMGGTGQILSGCHDDGYAMVRLDVNSICGLETKDATTLKCTWENTEYADGYEIRLVSVKEGETFVATGSALGTKTIIATGSALETNTITATGSSLGIKTVSELEEGESYAVSVRSYKNLENVGYFYSEWSAAERITMRENIVAFQGHQYRVVPALDYPTWEEIIAYCEAEGGYPATILSAEENEFLYNIMLSKGYKDAYFGFTDMETEGVWKWATGEESSYARWYTQSVDNYQNEDYAMFWRKIAGPYWNDGSLRNLDDKVAFICEWGELKPTPTPTPMPTATPTPVPERAPVDEVLDLKPEDFTYKSVSGYYSCTGLSKSGYEKFSKYLSKDTVTINLPSVSDTGKKVRGFYSDSSSGYDLSALMVSTSPYMRLVCPETYVIYSGETGVATDKVIAVELNEGMKTLYKGAFYNYTGLTRMILPESIKTYRAEVFKGCTNLVIETLITDGVSFGSAVFEDVTIKNVYISQTFDATSATVGTFYKANIENIVFEHGINKIPDDAFRQCYTLTEIVIPDTVKTIGKRAFKQCSSLVNVEFSTLPEKVELGSEAFYGCYVLRNTILPDNIMIYGEGVFSGCVSLEIEYFDTTEKTVNGSAFNGVTIKEVLITESFSAVDLAVSKSSDGAFEGAILKNIIFETGIGKIPDNTFRGCTGITEITIPDTVTHIDAYAFYLCNKLERVVLPESVVEISNGAFYGCELLEDIELDEVKVFGEESFMKCNKLVIEFFDTTDTTINSSAFSGVTINEIFVCNGFTGASVGIGQAKKGSFNGAEIGRILFEEGIITIGNDAFRNCSITEITIPDTVVTIGDSAFEACGSLKRIYLPDSVSVLGKGAFKNCSSLVKVEYPEGITIGADAFKGCSKAKLVPYVAE